MLANQYSICSVQQQCGEGVQADELGSSVERAYKLIQCNVNIGRMCELMNCVAA